MSKAFSSLFRMLKFILAFSFIISIFSTSTANAGFGSFGTKFFKTKTNPVQDIKVGWLMSSWSVAGYHDYYNSRDFSVGFLSTSPSITRNSGNYDYNYNEYSASIPLSNANNTFTVTMENWHHTNCANGYANNNDSVDTQSILVPKLNGTANPALVKSKVKIGDLDQYTISLDSASINDFNTNGGIYIELEWLMGGIDSIWFEENKAAAMTTKDIYKAGIVDGSGNSTVGNHQSPHQSEAIFQRNDAGSNERYQLKVDGNGAVPIGFTFPVKNARLFISSGNLPTTTPTVTPSTTPTVSPTISPTVIPTAAPTLPPPPLLISKDFSIFKGTQITVPKNQLGTNLNNSIVTVTSDNPKLAANSISGGITLKGDAVSQAKITVTAIDSLSGLSTSSIYNVFIMDIYVPNSEILIYDTDLTKYTAQTDISFFTYDNTGKTVDLFTKLRANMKNSDVVLKFNNPAGEILISKKYYIIKTPAVLFEPQKIVTKTFTYNITATYHNSNDPLMNTTISKDFKVTMLDLVIDSN